MIVDLSVFNVGNLTSSIVGGILGGLYLVAFHPPLIAGGPLRRSLRFAWFFTFLPSILYIARVAYAVIRDALDDDFVTDLPRVIAGWILFLLFAAFVGAGSYAGDRWRIRRIKRRLRAEQAG